MRLYAGQIFSGYILVNTNTLQALRQEIYGRQDAYRRSHIACSHADTGQCTDALARASHTGCPDQRRVGGSLNPMGDDRPKRESLSTEEEAFRAIKQQGFFWLVFLLVAFLLSMAWYLPGWRMPG
jgi:hypothetical protein